MSESAPAQRLPAGPRRAEPNVFICYSHEDAARVDPRVEFLMADGIGVWIDRKGIAAGKIWRREIYAALERATHVVLFVSRASLSSDHCEGEVHYGLDLKKTVVPVYLEDVQLSEGLRIALNRVQALHGYRLSDDELDQELRNAIRSEAAANAPPVPATAPKVPARPTRRNGVVWAGAALATLIAIASAIWWFSREQHATPLPTRSVAVLPFAAMSEDPRIRHLADAFVEELLNDFTAQRQIQVASRTGSAAKPADEGIQAFAAALNVSYVVEGSVRPGGDGDRVTAQLIRGSDGLHLWSQTFDLGQGGAEMESTASRVALNAFVYVENDVEIAEARTETSNDEAFAYYEKVVRLDPSGEQTDTNQVGAAQALVNLDKAIALDPEFPEPYLERTAHMSAVWAGWWGESDPAETRRMIDRYLEMRPDSAKGRTVLGLVQWADGDLAAAERSFKQACELEPEFPWPYSRLGLLAMRRGNAQEAADYFKQSTVNNAARPSHFFYGGALMALERFDEADRQFELGLRLFPNAINAMVARVHIAHLRGRDDEAKARFEPLWAKYGKIAPEYFIHVLPLVGHEQDLRDLMKQWDAGTRPTNAALRFLAYNSLHEYDTAIDWLLRAIDEGLPEYLLSLRVDKVFPEIHAHPRYAEVAAKLDATEVTH